MKIPRKREKIPCIRMTCVQWAGSVGQNRWDSVCLVPVLVLLLIGGVILSYLLPLPRPQFPIPSHSWSLAVFAVLWMPCRVKPSWASSLLWKASVKPYDLKAALALYYQGLVLCFVIIQTSCFSHPPMLPSPLWLDEREESGEIESNVTSRYSL